MIPIDEEEEKLIENNKEDMNCENPWERVSKLVELNAENKSVLTFNRGNRTFSVSMRDIYCYGEVDFEDKDTLNQISEFKFLDYLGEVGVPIYSRYDYKTHSCSSPKQHCLWTETWNPAELAKMAHGYLGKPKRILLFNQNKK